MSGSEVLCEVVKVCGGGLAFAAAPSTAGPYGIPSFCTVLCHTAEKHRKIKERNGSQWLIYLTGAGAAT
jgi:hypothetical protein